MRRFSSFIILFFLTLLVILYLPANLPWNTWIAKKTWESVALLRFYVGRCAGENPSFLTYLIAHPVPTLLFYVSSKIFPFLPSWKQFAIVTIESYTTGGFFLFLILKRYVNITSAVLLTFFFMLQLPLWEWSFSPFAYIIGFAFLTSGLYLFVEKKRIEGLILISLLPLIRHELFVIPLGMAIILLFNDHKNKFLKVIIVTFPFILYYIIVSWVRYNDPFFLFFGYRQLFFNNESVGQIIFKGKRVDPSIFLYFNPLLYVFPLFFYSPRTSSFYRLLFPFTLLLFLVPYVSKALIPVMLVGFLGPVIYASEKNFNITTVSIFLVILQLTYLVLIGTRKEPYDLIAPYRAQKNVYSTLSKMDFDYFLYPLDNYFVVLEDRKCILAKKLLFSPGAVEVCNFDEHLLLPDGRVLSSEKFLSMHENKIILTLTSTVLLNDPLFFKKNFLR